MAAEYVLERFLNAQGKCMEVGDKAPDEDAQNLNHYRSYGLIGGEQDVETRYPNKDVGRPGKAATRKAKSKTEPQAD